jgi:hypothetical protein
MRNTIPSPNLGQEAATRRFPSEAKLIEEVIIRNESFRGLCDDLAEAERALAATEEMPEPLRSDRQAERREWVESLTNEIGRALRIVQIVCDKASR